MTRNFYRRGDHWRLQKYKKKIRQISVGRTQNAIAAIVQNGHGKKVVFYKQDITFFYFSSEIGAMDQPGSHGSGQKWDPMSRVRPFERGHFYKPENIVQLYMEIHK